MAISGFTNPQTGPRQKDTDLDGVPDVSDNCTLVANSNQRDTQGNGFGNLCDGDLNNDLIVNSLIWGCSKIAI